MGRAPKVSWDRVYSLLASGHGTGFGEDYLPPLQIKRWNPSPMSVQVLKPLPPFLRRCHFFSHSEWFLALLFSWIGALIREQYPCWPWPHQHPEYGRRPEVDTTLPWSDGMISICRDMGISHGCFVGTDIPYFWTMDLALTLPWVDNPARACCLVSIKPLESERYLYIDPLDRGPEKLEAERRYSKALGVPYFIGDRSLFPGPLFSQLEFLAASAILPDRNPLRATLRRFLDAHGNDLAIYPLSDIPARLQLDYGVTSNHATFLLNHILWHQLVDCDLSINTKNSLPPRPGGRTLRDALRASIQGGDQ
jgi:hypothetical protein